MLLGKARKPTASLSVHVKLERVGIDVLSVSCRPQDYTRIKRVSEDLVAGEDITARYEVCQRFPFLGRTRRASCEKLRFVFRHSSRCQCYPAALCTYPDR